MSAMDLAADLLAIFKVESATELTMERTFSGELLVWRTGTRSGAISVDVSLETILREQGAVDGLSTPDHGLASRGIPSA